MIPKPSKRTKKPRKPLRKKSTKTERKRLMALAVATFNEYIRKKYPACFDCGSPAEPTCGHLITAKKESTRFDEMNCFRQTRGCNFRHEHQPEIYTRAYIQKFGFQAYEELISRSNRLKKHTCEELRGIIDTYRGKLKSLESA